MPLSSPPNLLREPHSILPIKPAALPDIAKLIKSVVSSPLHFIYPAFSGKLGHLLTVVGYGRRNLLPRFARYRGKLYFFFVKRLLAIALRYVTRRFEILFLPSCSNVSPSQHV